MDKRPLSVTIIAWFLIVSSIISAFTLWSSFDSPISQQVLADSPLPRSVHRAVAASSLALHLVIGVALLMRQNWARFLYVGLGLFSIVIQLIASPMLSIVVLSITFLVLIAFFLFRRPASDWFRRAPA